MQHTSRGWGHCPHPQQPDRGDTSSRPGHEGKYDHGSTFPQLLLILGTNIIKQNNLSCKVVPPAHPPPLLVPKPARVQSSPPPLLRQPHIYFSFFYVYRFCLCLLPVCFEPPNLRGSHFSVTWVGFGRGGGRSLLCLGQSPTVSHEVMVRGGISL